MESLDFTDDELRTELSRCRKMAELLRSHGETSAAFYDASVRALQNEINGRADAAK